MYIIFTIITVTVMNRQPDEKYQQGHKYETYKEYTYKETYMMKRK